VSTYADPQEKFHHGTCAPQPTPSGVWLAIGGAGMIVGEAAFQPSWPWLSVAALAVGGVAGLVWRSRSRSSAALTLGMAVLATVLIGSAWRTWRASVRTDAVAVTAIQAATEERDRLLASSVAAAIQIGRNALQRTDGVVPGEASDLDDLLSGPIELGLVVLGGDSVVAVAGQQRVLPEGGGDLARLVRLPFAHLLVVSTTGSTGRVAQMTLLLDADPALPMTGGSLADAATGWNDVDWAWNGSAQEIAFPTIDSVLAAVPRLMVATAPLRESLLAREAILARWSASLALALVAIIVLLAGAPPLARALALILPGWVLYRAGVMTDALGPIAMPALLSAATLLMIAVVLWRRPARRTPSGMVASLILLGLAPPLVALAGWKMAATATSTGMLSWFGWQVVLALASAAYLAVASAPLRTTGDEGSSWRPAMLALMLTIGVGILGIEAWQPGIVEGDLPAGWDSTWLWYLPAWLIVLSLQLRVMPPAARRVTVVVSASLLAALSAWGGSLDSRIWSASDDIDRLAAGTDSSTIANLIEFGDQIELTPVQSLDSLYARWRGSPLAQSEIPAQLAIWSDTTVISWVALDALAPSWDDLQSVVALRPLARREQALARGFGEHRVIVVPVGGDSVVSVLIGPRSAIVAPTRFGRMVGWRSLSEPRYSLTAMSGRDVLPDGVFRRTGRNIHADRRVSAGEEPAVIRANITIPRPAPFAVRASLTVLVDVLLVLLIWWTVERILGVVSRADTAVFRRSYRRTVAAALTSFFVVPAALFTLWSALRLQNDIESQRDADVSRALSDIESVPEFATALGADSPGEWLEKVADRVDAEVAIYRTGRLVGSSTPLLVSLGVVSPFVDQSRVVGDPGVEPGRLARGNVRVGLGHTPIPGTVVSAALPGADGQPGKEQIDLALLLLLASLGGTLAAVAVAGAVARALGQPIEALRQRAISIGRREPVAPLRVTVAEFEPVFGAITQMEADLRASEAKLEEETTRTAQVVAWGEMARQVAHEIKNPLTPMRLGLQHLKRLASDNRPELPEQMTATTGKLLAEIDRLDRIARSFARYGTPPEQHDGPLEAVDLNEVCEEVSKLFTVADSQPSVEVLGNGGGPVMARREELIQVLLNLLGNARQAEASKVVLRLGESRLTVEDNGHGISSEQLEKIFEPTFSTTTSGTGLGLAIVRRLVESWKGVIQVDSKVGEGTSFTVEFGTDAST
jgi:signal transduction histidine kinase